MTAIAIRPAGNAPHACTRIGMAPRPSAAPASTDLWAAGLELVWRVLMR